jgi:hypothetical protein
MRGGGTADHQCWSHLVVKEGGGAEDRRCRQRVRRLIEWGALVHGARLVRDGRAGLVVGLAGLVGRGSAGLIVVGLAVAGLSVARLTIAGL